MVVTATVWNTCLAGRFEGVVPKEILDGKPLIERPRPDSRGGQAYRLIYVVDVPVETYWRFKTDFDNTFVVTHRFITFHRVVRKTGNGV